MTNPTKKLSYKFIISLSRSLCDQENWKFSTISDVSLAACDENILALKNTPNPVEGYFDRMAMVDLTWAMRG